MSDKPYLLNFSNPENGPAITSREWPHNIRFHIPLADRVLYHCLLGTFFTQTLEGHNSFVELLTWTVYHYGYFEITVKKNTNTLLYIMDGSLEIWHKGIRLNLLKAGYCTAVYFPVGTYQLYIEQGTANLLNVIPRKTVLKALAKMHPEINALIERQHTANRYLKLLTPVPISAAITSELLKPAHKETQDGRKEIVEMQLSLHFVSAYGEQLQSMKQGPLYAFITHINTHLTEYQSGDIPRLAKQFNIHYRTLIRKFEQLMGMTIIDYIIHERLKKAHELITTTAFPLITIAEKVGYNNFTHFSRDFKLRFNYTPGTLRLRRKENF